MDPVTFTFSPIKQVHFIVGYKSHNPCDLCGIFVVLLENQGRLLNIFSSEFAVIISVFQPAHPGGFQLGSQSVF